MEPAREALEERDCNTCQHHRQPGSPAARYEPIREALRREANCSDCLLTPPTGAALPHWQPIAIVRATLLFNDRNRVV